MDRLLTTEQVSQLTGLSKSWFEHQRWLGGDDGPKFIRIGRSVRYRPSDVQEWLDKAQRKTAWA